MPDPVLFDQKGAIATITLKSLRHVIRSAKPRSSRGWSPHWPVRSPTPPSER